MKALMMVSNRFLRAVSGINDNYKNRFGGWDCFLWGKKKLKRFDRNIYNNEGFGVNGERLFPCGGGQGREIN